MQLYALTKKLMNCSNAFYQDLLLLVIWLTATLAEADYTATNL